MLLTPNDSLSRILCSKIPGCTTEHQKKERKKERNPKRSYPGFEQRILLRVFEAWI
jgi:hypothetical protein